MQCAYYTRKPKLVSHEILTPVSQFTGTGYQFHTQCTNTTCIWWYLSNTNHLNTITPVQKKTYTILPQDNLKEIYYNERNMTLHFGPLKSLIFLKFNFLDVRKYFYQAMLVISDHFYILISRTSFFTYDIEFSLVICICISKTNLLHNLRIYNFAIIFKTHILIGKFT